MLVLSRKVMESITIGDNVVVTLLGMRGTSVRIGIEAPKKVVTTSSCIRWRLLLQFGRGLLSIGSVMVDSFFISGKNSSRGGM